MGEEPTSGTALLASSRFREIFRCRRAAQHRIYGLYLAPQGIELWRITHSPGAPMTAVKEADLSSAEEATALFHDIGLSLRVAGWREESHAESEEP